ncbi:hypothetical protein BV22DRAFT_868253 [Leucogyrophana mollusca]|uniref:Uncharacterized protein n=1 Tax=Leucogyrophana mollusca TaxID=85980 RepID=A0ACB8B161_9AGAM|nr:hypothetical protein BV22DRAFT_868253 [Leucogyrophana mollusca]
MASCSCAAETWTREGSWTSTEYIWATGIHSNHTAYVCINILHASTVSFQHLERPTTEPTETQQKLKQPAARNHPNPHKNPKTKKNHLQILPRAHALREHPLVARVRWEGAGGGAERPGGRDLREDLCVGREYVVKERGEGARGGRVRGRCERKMKKREVTKTESSQCTQPVPPHKEKGHTSTASIPRPAHSGASARGSPPRAGKHVRTVHKRDSGGDTHQPEFYPPCCGPSALTPIHIHPTLIAPTPAAHAAHSSRRTTPAPRARPTARPTHSTPPRTPRRAGRARAS